MSSFIDTSNTTNHWELGFSAMTKNNIALDHDSALKALKENAHSCIRKIMRSLQKTSSLKEFESYVNDKKFRDSVLYDYRRMLPQNQFFQKADDFGFEALFLRNCIQQAFGLDIMEETTMTALMYSQWYNGQQKIYLVEQELYDGISVELETPEKMAPIQPISDRLSALTHKLQTIVNNSRGVANINNPQYATLLENQEELEKELYECDGWRMENPPPIKEDDLEPTMVIFPNGKTLLVCAGLPAPLSSRFGNLWSRRLYHKASRYIERIMFQTMLNSHALLQKLNSGFFVCQLNSFTDFHRSMGVAPVGGGVEYSFAGSTVFVNYELGHMKHLYMDTPGLSTFWLAARKSARETLNFISALQHPKTVVTSIKSSESRKKRKKKKFGNKYQPRLCTIKVDPETLNLIRPLREPSQKTGREMPRFDVPDGKANRWVTRVNLKVGEVVLATRQGKRDNRLYLVNRPRVGYTCNEHKEPIVRVEKSPKIIKAKRF